MIEGSNLPIQGVKINWDKIDEYSYLREIDAIKDLDYLAFRKNRDVKDFLHHYFEDM